MIFGDQETLSNSLILKLTFLIDMEGKYGL